MGLAKWLIYQVQAECDKPVLCCSFFSLSSDISLSPSHSTPDTPTSCSTCSPSLWPPLLFTGRFTKKQLGFHGNVETAEKWQLNAAAPHLISTLALTEQIMGNNTPLCCGKMKCFSSRLSCWGIYLLLYQHPFPSTSLPFFLFLLAQGSFSLPPFTSIAHFYILSSSIFPSILSPLLWINCGFCVHTCTYNNHNYLCNDLQATKHIQTHFPPIWVVRQLHETSRAWMLLSILWV